jgi:hypothetical protein
MVVRDISINYSGLYYNEVDVYSVSLPPPGYVLGQDMGSQKAKYGTRKTSGLIERESKEKPWGRFYSVSRKRDGKGQVGKQRILHLG